MKSVLFGIGAAILLAGCCSPYGSNIGVGVGGIIEQKNPAQFNIDNSVQPLKCGVAQTKGIVLYSTGDASIKAAMDNGGIKKVHHVDVDVLSFFNVYTVTKTVVWGE